MSFLGGRFSFFLSFQILVPVCVYLYEKRFKVITFYVAFILVIAFWNIPLNELKTQQTDNIFFLFLIVIMLDVPCR